jgi:hypothetical protein
MRIIRVLTIKQNYISIALSTPHWFKPVCIGFVVNIDYEKKFDWAIEHLAVSTEQRIAVSLNSLKRTYLMTILLGMEEFRGFTVNEGASQIHILSPSLILWWIWCLLRNGFQNTRYITKKMWQIWCLLRSGFQIPRYITKTYVSIASQRLGIPRQPNCWKL